MSGSAQLIQDAIHNQFLSGGLVLMVTGAVMALARNVPIHVWDFLKRQFSITIDVIDADPVFEWLTLWLNEHPYSKRSRLLSVSSHYNPEDGDALTGRVLFSPAPGNHLLMYKHRLVYLMRTRSDQQAQPSGAVVSSARRVESYHIQILGRSQKIARDLIHDAIECARRVEKARLKAYISTYGYWRKLQGYSPRPIESVILPSGQIQTLMDDVKLFISRRNWYHQIGIPYHRGYLFHGTPGTGKTSLISALAGALQMNLYVLNIAGENMSDERLFDMFMDIQPNSILLLEDVDAVTRNRETQPGDGEKDKGVTLSGLLNCIDGILAKDGSLLFMTTNYKERLDPALIRPGRVDVHLEFTPAADEQIAGLFQRFFPASDNSDDFAERFPRPATMAEVQQHLLRHSGDDNEAVESISQQKVTA